MPTLVLLPGMDGTGVLFSPLIENLPKDWHVQVARYPANESLGYAQLIELAAEFIPKTGDYVLLGESFSGPIAVSLATSADQRLKSLILCCSFVRSPIGFGAALLRRLSFLPLSTVPFSLIEYALLGRFRTDTVASLLRSTLKRVSPHVLGHRIREVISVDVTAALEKVEAPILYLRASDDRLVPNNAGREVARAARNFELANLEGPHCLLQASPARAAAVIQAFLSKHGVGNGR